MRAFDPVSAQRSLFDALIDAAETHGWGKPCLEDQDRKPLTYHDLVRACFALGRKIAARTTPGERVALLLPTSAAGAVTFFALQADGRTPTMLNFTSGPRNLKAALGLSGARLILTSRRFVAQARLEDLVAELEPTAAVVYLEDLRAAIGLADKLFAAAAGAAPRLFRKALKPNDAGVILFTSGSFAAPRGVVLTQANVVSNALQVAAVIDLSPSWILFNPLPIFHALGLVGTMLPLLCGMKAFLYPSPLHTKMVVDLVRDSKATILLTTDTFMGQYARAAEPQDFADLEIVVFGAEKVRDSTRVLVSEKFGPAINLLEGYGATEASPVIAVNPPHDNRPATVGALMPALETRLVAVDGIAEGGRLHVRGPNVMAGYLDEGGLRPPEDGWHDTGDIAVLEADGYLRLLGRAKRFAKIAGEMISLSAVEDLAADVWPDGWRAVVALADARKGERLVLVTDVPDAQAAALLAHAQAVGAPEISVPKKVIRVGAPVLLGTGKTDYAAVQRIAEAET